MHIKTVFRWLGLGILACGLSACVQSSATVTSNKAADYHADIKRLLILTDLSAVFGSAADSNQTILEAKVTDALAQCDITVQFHRHDSLALGNELQPAIQAFSPDTLMTIAPRLASSGGGLQQADIIASVVDMRTKRLVWKGEIDMKLAWSGAETMASALVDRLKTDGILSPACPRPTIPLRGI